MVVVVVVVVDVVEYEEGNEKQQTYWSSTPEIVLWNMSTAYWPANMGIFDSHELGKGLLVADKNA